MVNSLSKKELIFRLMNPKWKIRLLARDFYYLDFLSGPVEKILGLANILVPPSTILESNIFLISNIRKKRYIQTLDPENLSFCKKFGCWNNFFF